MDLKNCQKQYENEVRWPPYGMIGFMYIDSDHVKNATGILS